MLLLFQHHASDIYSFQHKVMFDGPNRLILVNNGVTNLNVEQDIYSDWKEWLTLRDNAKYFPALRTIGGDPTINGDFVGGTFFLINGWKIRTWEGDHQLIVDGNLYSDNFGLEYFADTIEPHNIIVSQRVSNIVDKVVSTEGALTPDQSQTLDRVGRESRLHTTLLLKQNSKPG